MILIPENAGDIQKYYRNSFVKFKETGDRLFYIDNVNKQYLSGQDEEQEDFEFWYHEAAPASMEYVLPRKSYFQRENNAFLLRRIPAKQYHRGMTGDNTRIMCLRSDGVLSPVSLEFSLLKAYVSKETFVPIMDAFTTKKASVVLSKRFAFVPKTGGLLLDDVCVAVRTGEKTITCKYGVFESDIKALCQGTNIEVVR